MAITSTFCCTPDRDRSIMANQLLKLCVKYDLGKPIAPACSYFIGRMKLELPENTGLFRVIRYVADKHNDPENPLISLVNIGKRDIALSCEMHECISTKRHGALNKLFRTLMTREEYKNTRYMLSQLAKWASPDDRNRKYHFDLVFSNLAIWFNHLKDEQNFEVPLFYLLRKCYPISSLEQYGLCKQIGLGEEFLKNLLQVRASVLFSHNACGSKIRIDSSYMVVLIEACIVAFIVIPKLGFESPKIEWFMENFVKKADFGNALEILKDFVIFSLRREDLGQEIDELITQRHIFWSGHESTQNDKNDLYAKVEQRFEESKLIFSANHSAYSLRFLQLFTTDLPSP